MGMKWELEHFSKLFLIVVMFSHCNFKSGGAASVSTMWEDDLGFNRNHTGVFFDPETFAKYNGLPNKLDRDGMEVLIKTIQTRFDQIGIPLSIDNLDFGKVKSISSQFMEAVARRNLDLQREHFPPIQLTILLQWGSWNVNESLARLQQVRLQITDPPNKLVPGTVKTILLKIKASLSNPLQTFYELKKSFIPNCNDKLGHPYQLGIVLEMKDCEEFNTVTSNWKNILRYGSLDKVYFVQSLKSESMMGTLALDRYLEMFTNTLHHCKGLLKSLALKTKAGFITTWPDTDMEGHVRYSNLVKFWRRMNSWAGEGNSSIFLLQAFDLPMAEDLLTRTSGWWRLLPNTSYFNSSAYQFTDKGRLALLEKQRESKSQIANRAWLRQKTEFDKSKLGVSLYPISWTTSVDRENERRLPLPIQKVSQKFSKILISTEQNVTGKGSRWTSASTAKSHVESVSRVIKMLLKNGDWNGNNSTELILPFHSTTVSQVKRLANFFHPFPTVPVLLLYRPNFQVDNLTTTAASIESVAWPSHDLGIELPLEVCEEEDGFNFSMERLEVLKFRVIFVSGMVTPTQSQLGFERIFPLLTVMFGNCRRKLEEHFTRLGTTVEIDFMTGWPLTGEDRVEELIYFVKFWEHMNHWAVETNATVIMSRAFDDPLERTDLNKLRVKYGWWRLAENDSIHGDLDDFTFENIKEVALRLSEEGTPGDSTVNTPFTFGVLHISVTVLVLTVVASLITIAYHWRRTRNSNYLSTAELAEFFNGGGGSLIFGKDSGNMDGRYNIELYELPNEAFTIDESSELGSGEFGKVCRCTIQKDGEDCVEAAVKMTKVPCTRSALKGLFYEIKILSFLGKHPNIVELKGAYTAELKKSKLFVFLELCTLGSLKSYLTRLKRAGDDETGNGPEIDDLLGTDMLRWSGEIANGMEYIASKHVVHMDLAIRNILLTSEKLVKITDFGLSRRMYNYQSYFKKKNEQDPLPWRSMAPESLRRLEFTEKSDVWGFGVTLWEMFTLGEEPYAGLGWNVNFPNQLERGLRLKEPPHNPNQVYSIMCRCWAMNPESRPTFSELANILCQDLNRDSSTTDPALPIPPGMVSLNESQVIGLDQQVSELHPAIFGSKWLSPFLKWHLPIVPIIFLFLAVLTAIIMAIYAFSNMTDTSSSTGNVTVIQEDKFAPALSPPTPSPTSVEIYILEWEDIMSSFDIETCTFDNDDGNVTLLHRLLSNTTRLTSYSLHNLTLHLVENNCTELFNSPGGPLGVTPLQLAVRNLEVDPRTLLLLHSSCFNFDNIATDAEGYSLLFYAVEGGRNASVLSMLLTLGAVWDQSNKSGRTLLHLAVEVGNLEVVEFLVNLGLNVNSADLEGLTPLHSAVELEKNCMEITNFLIEAGADINSLDELFQSPLHKVAFNNFNMETSLTLVKHFIEMKANVFAQDVEGHTFLHHLLMDGTTVTPVQLHDLTEFLVANGYSTLFNVTGGGWQATPLQWGIETVEVEQATLSLLLQNGVNFEPIDTQRNSLLFYAIRGRRSLNLLSILLQFGADVQGRDNLNRNLFHIAAQAGNVEALGLLLNYGLDINAVDMAYRKTPLHRAVQFGPADNLEVVKFLVEHGADLDAPDENQRVPLFFAALNEKIDTEGCLGIIKYLIQSGADALKTDKWNDTFLHGLLADRRRVVGGNVDQHTYMG